MKKQWLLCAFALIQLNVWGQTEKGGKLIGASLGSFNYTYQTQRYYRTPSSNPGPPYYTNSYNFTVSPSIAWLVKNNFAIGPNVILTYAHTKQNNAGTKAAHCIK